MDRLKHISVGVDFSECSALALAQAVRIARWNDARLDVIHVIDETVVRELQGVVSELSSESEVRDDVLRAARQRVEAMLATTGTSPSDVNVTVVIGNPFVDLARRVGGPSTDLLVLGASGASGQLRGAGALATKCVRKAAAHVLLVRGTEAQPSRQMVACVDFSAASPQIIEYALRAADREQAKLHVLHVFAAPWNVLHYRAPTTKASPDFQRQYRDSLKGCLAELLRPFQARVERLAVEQHLVESTYPALKIVEFARDCDADLVIVGVRGHSTLAAVLMGSTAERVVRDCPCSVLAVKPPDFHYNIG